MLRFVPLKRLLIERTEGNPLFLEESVRALAETGHSAGRAAGPTGSTRLPPASKCPPPCKPSWPRASTDSHRRDKRLLQAAAVIGKDIPYALLQAIAELAGGCTCAVGLAHLQRREFLYETSLSSDLAYTFKHALTHEVAYGSLLQEPAPPTCTRRIVEAIERLYAERLAEQLERLGYHALRGEAWDKAVTYLARPVRRRSRGRPTGKPQRGSSRRWTPSRTAPKAPVVIQQGIDLRFDLRSALHPQGEFERILDVSAGSATAGRARGRPMSGWRGCSATWPSPSPSPACPTAPWPRGIAPSKIVQESRRAWSCGSDQLRAWD